MSVCSRLIKRFFKKRNPRNQPGLPFPGAVLALVAMLLFSGQGAEAPDNLKSLDREFAQAIKTAEALRRTGNFEAAFTLYGQAKNLARKMKDREKEVRCSMDLGKLSWPLGRPEESRGFYAEALGASAGPDLARENEECRLALKVLDLYSRGKEGRLRGEFGKSILKLGEAVEVARKIGSREHEAKCLRQLSLTHWANQEQEHFLSLSLRALEIASGLQDRRDQVKCLSNIGMYFFWRKDYVKALDHYSRSLELAREIRSREDESLCLNNISLILMHFGFYEKSADFLEASAELYPESGKDYFLSQTLNNLGEAFRNKGLLLSSRSDLIKALGYFSRALEIMSGSRDKKTELKILNNIGKIHLDLEKAHTARHYLEAGLETATRIEDKEGSLRILANLGNCHLITGNHDKARAYFQQALDLGKRIHSTRIFWELFFSLGQCSEKAGDDDRARAYYEDSLAAIDRTRVQILPDDFKAGFMRNKFKVYESLVSLLFRLYERDPAPALVADIFYVVERAKARAFLETLGEAQASPGGLIVASLPGEKPRDKPGSSERSLNVRETAGESAFPSPVPARHVQDRLLDEKTAILEYFLGGTKSFLFLITKEDISLFVLPPRDEIRTSLAAFLVFLSRPPRADWGWIKAARRLSRDLLGPAWESLPSRVERLIIIPDDILCHLPFETLTLPSPEEGFLIEKCAVSYAPSCSSLLFLKERKREKPFARALLAFGNPAYPSPAQAGKSRLTIAGIAKAMAEEHGLELSPLEKSEKEIRDIQRHFPQDRRDIYLGEKASEEVIKKSGLEDYQVIHFACHGFLDERVPFRSGLFLSLNQGGEEDGFLQASEIARLRMAAELVVLSACRTSKGYLEKGEGIMGLTRTFFYSGARSVVSTLWKISDHAAAEFMRHFYDNLSRGNDKAEALRLAKLRLLGSRYSHPFFWAAFVLHGEASSALELR